MTRVLSPGPVSNNIVTSIACINPLAFKLIEAIITLTERWRLLAIERWILYNRIYVRRNTVTVSDEVSNKNSLADNKLYRQIARHTATGNR
jgi:hypothetical protein